MAEEIQNDSFDSDDDNSIFITQEPAANLESKHDKRDEGPVFDLDIESLTDTSVVLP